MDQERTYKWIQDRLRELNAGTITDTDFRQLETLAKEDPFVADALEGYQLNPDLDHTEFLDSLAQKIKPHKRERRRWLIPNLTVTAVAASLILIVGFYAVMTRLSTKTDQGLATTTTSEHTLSLEKSGDTMVIVPDQENSVAAAEQSQPVAAAEMPRTESQRKSISKPSAHTEDKQKIAASEPTRSQPADATYAVEDTKTKGVSPPYGKEPGNPDLTEPAKVTAVTAEKEDAGYAANQMDPKVMAQRVAGEIKTIDGEPLIGVTLLVRGTNLSAVTQIDGKFELYLPEGESTVDVLYGGYENSEIILKPGDENVDVRLKELASSAMDAVLAGKASSVTRTKSASPKISTVPLPSDENLLFIDYLKANSKFPLAENLNTSAKIVMLEFLINVDGHPNQIKVTHSSGTKALDDEAVRLIKKGPDWNCGEQQYPCKVKYSIYFR